MQDGLIDQLLENSRHLGKIPCSTKSNYQVMLHFSKPLNDFIKPVHLIHIPKYLKFSPIKDLVKGDSILLMRFSPIKLVTHFSVVCIWCVINTNYS